MEWNVNVKNKRYGMLQYRIFHAQCDGDSDGRKMEWRFGDAMEVRPLCTVVSRRTEEVFGERWTCY